MRSKLAGGGKWRPCPCSHSTGASLGTWRTRADNMGHIPPSGSRIEYRHLLCISKRGRPANRNSPCSRPPFGLTSGRIRIRTWPGMSSITQGHAPLLACGPLMVWASAYSYERYSRNPSTPGWRLGSQRLKMVCRLNPAKVCAGGSTMRTHYICTRCTVRACVEKGIIEKIRCYFRVRRGAGSE